MSSQASNLVHSTHINPTEYIHISKYDKLVAENAQLKQTIAVLTNYSSILQKENLAQRQGSRTEQSEKKTSTPDHRNERR
jgi:hypothetical protein